ncbi:precorrin-6A reductase [Pectinatus haikarae]|uniref:precorrin-6A reductase n=1 Tax=Pectinatus haikarae TaxID=349096 RepID=UPI0018C5B581|nr:precorrin-6A reductase [Pectinatus haikarae]
MIFLAAGTQDGRQIAQLLLQNGYEVTASVVSGYGKILLSGHQKLTVIEQMLDEKAMQKILQDINAKIFVDASHPYAVNISQTAMRVCRQLGIYYLRYERPAISLPDYEKLYKTNSFEAAAKKAFELGRNVFLTTGSRHLTEFTAQIKSPEQTLTVRVLPAVESIQACINEGILLKHVIAMQGPFSKELNKSMYAHTKAEVVVMKNSGSLGGSDTKLSAAIEAGIFVVVIGRPPLEYDNIVTDSRLLIDKIKKVGEK